MVTVPDRDGSVYVPSIQRPTRAGGRGTPVPRSDWTIADLRRDYQHQPPAVLRQEADDLAHLPPLLRDWAWWRLAAVAAEACERLLVLSIVDSDTGQEVA